MSGLSSARLGVYFSVLFVAYAVSTYCRRLLYVFSKEVSSEIGFTNEQFGTSYCMVGYNGSDPVNGVELTSADYSEAGLVSGIATRAIIQPLDVLKIRFQLQEEPIRGQLSGKYKGVIQSISVIVKEEGVSAFWKGHVPAQGLSAMYGLVQFSSFEWFTRQASVRLQPTARWQGAADFVCGGLAGCAAMTAAMPLDVIRTRLVAQGHGRKVYRGMTHAVASIWRREGVPGYFRGWVPSIVQIAPYTGLQFMLYNLFMKWWTRFIREHESKIFLRRMDILMNRVDEWDCDIDFSKDEPLSQPQDGLGPLVYRIGSGRVGGALLCGAAAGTVAKTLLYPLDMVRHRLQMNGFQREGFGRTSNYNIGMVRTIAHVVKHESIYGLFKGLWPSQIKAAANSGFAFLFYELFCDIIRSRKKHYAGAD